jgi:hypothetical protein
VTRPKARARPDPEASDPPARPGAELSGVPAAAARELRSRYTAADLGAFTRDEASRFVPLRGGDPHNDVVLAWELLYRLEPELYERLARAERLHPGVVDWLPREVDQIAEVGAGTGRLTSLRCRCAGYCSGSWPPPTMENGSG